MKGFVLAKLSCLIFVFLTGVNLSFSNPVKFVNAEKIQLLGQNIDYLVDSSNSLKVSDVLGSTQFIKSDKGVMNFVTSKSAVWIRFQILNLTQENDLILNYAQPTTNLVELYTLDGNRVVNTTVLGEHKKFEDRFYSHPNYLFPINIEKDSVGAYIMKLESRENILIPLSIGSETKVLEKNNKEGLLSGLFFGIILVMIFYNLFLYFSIKDVSYLYYVVYILLVGITQVSLQGYTFQYLWPESAFFAKNNQVIFPCLVGIASLEFQRVFLSVPKYLPKVKWLSVGFILIYVSSIVLNFFDLYVMAHSIMQISAMVVSLYMLVLSIIIINKGYRPAKFFLFAWFVFLSGVCIFILKDVGVLPYNGFTRYTMQIGSGIEVILLSFGLADRINILKKEKENSQQETLHALLENERIIKEQNEMLEIEVKKRTRDLEETQSQLVSQEKMASLGQLTAGVAHEINNPINFVTANVKPLRRDIHDIVEIINKYETLHEGDNKEEVLREISNYKKEIDFDYTLSEVDTLLNGIGEGAERTAQIVSGLKAFSRIDQHDLGEVNIHTGLDSTLMLLQNGMKNIQLEKKYGEIPEIECFSGKINQVFMNILNNAIQAIEEDKGQKGTPKITITTQAISHQEIKISFEDNGGGIPEEIKEKIFDPFFTTKDVGVGTGMGLSIVFGIIQEHNGNINVESTYAKGTIFEITLPVKQMN